MRKATPLEDIKRAFSKRKTFKSGSKFIQAARPKVSVGGSIGNYPSIRAELIRLRDSGIITFKTGRTRSGKERVYSIANISLDCGNAPAPTETNNTGVGGTKTYDFGEKIEQGLRLLAAGMKENMSIDHQREVSALKHYIERVEAERDDFKTRNEELAMKLAEKESGGYLKRIFGNN